MQLISVIPPYQERHFPDTASSSVAINIVCPSSWLPPICMAFFWGQTAGTITHEGITLSCHPGVLLVGYCVHRKQVWPQQQPQKWHISNDSSWKNPSPPLLNSHTPPWVSRDQFNPGNVGQWILFPLLTVTTKGNGWRLLVCMAQSSNKSGKDRTSHFTQAIRTMPVTPWSYSGWNTSLQKPGKTQVLLTGNYLIICHGQ